MKNKALKISLFIVVVPAIFTGCVDTKSLELDRQEVVYHDGGSTTEDGRPVVVIDENSTKAAERKIKHSAFNRADPKVETNDDGSQTTTTFDGYGNKTDSRCFKNNASLKCVVVETSFDGKVEITAYGKNGEIKKIGDDKIKNILDAPANEIVSKAEFSADSVKADISKLMPSKKSDANIAPLPSQELSELPKQAQITPTETIQNTETVSESEPVETEDQDK